mgnify:CR=1 FL=1
MVRARFRTAAALVACCLSVGACSSIDESAFENGLPTTLGTTPLSRASSDSATSVPTGPTIRTEQDETTTTVTSPGAPAPDGNDPDPPVGPQDPLPEPDAAAPPPDPGAADGTVVSLVSTIVSSTTRADAAFTQGLEFHDGVLIEGTGLYGSSSRRLVSPTSATVPASAALGPQFFGTGLTVSDGTILQLTWREGTAIISDPDTLTELDRLSYEGEGWGICRTDEQLIMSDGTSQLTVRDPMSFREIATIEVTIEGRPLSALAELDCVEGSVWATVWLTNDLVRIDLATGKVIAVADLSALAPPGASADDVLSGVAYRADTDTFYVTGKRWDMLYELRLTPRP